MTNNVVQFPAKRRPSPAKRRPNTSGPRMRIKVDHGFEIRLHRAPGRPSDETPRDLVTGALFDPRGELIAQTLPATRQGTIESMCAFVDYYRYRQYGIRPRRLCRPVG